MAIDPYKLVRIVGIFAFLCLAVFLTIESWILPLALLIVMTFLVLIVRKPKSAILFILATKPVVDATWAFKLPGIGLNFLQITGVAFPVLVFLIIYSNRVLFRNYRAVKLYGLFVAINFFSYFLSTIGQGSSVFEGVISFVKSSGVLFQFLNSYAAYLIIPYLFDTDQERKQLFWALVLAGIFPAVTGLMQMSGLITGRTLRTTGELIRISGFYHDSVNMRMYSFQTLIAIYVYLTTYVKPSNRFWSVQQIICYSLIPVLLLIIYRGYSKAAMGILLAWLIIYFVLRGKLITGTVALALILSAYITSGTVRNETERLFYKEIKYAEGTLPEHLEYTLLGGRFVFWGGALADFDSKNIEEQLFGYDYVFAATIHNDFLRVAIANGIVGLVVYILLLISLVASLFNSYFINRDTLSIASIMLFASFIIDSIGLVPLVYPGYCWIVFGLISLSLNRNAFKHKNQPLEGKEPKPA